MSTAHWESFYRAGTLAACPTGPEPNYSHKIRELWDRFFSALPSGSRILDLGTGNGALAVIALESAARAGHNFEIHGVDIAQIDPRNNSPDAESRFGDIEFHAGVSSEALPFEDSSFDAIVGQYILEYTNTGNTLREARRVLSSSGECRFVVHHEDSLIVRNAAESLQQYEIGLQHLGMLDLLRKCIGFSEPETRTAERELLAAGQQLLQAARTSSNRFLVDFFLDSVETILANREAVGPESLWQVVSSLEADMADWELRLRQLVTAAVGEGKLATVLGQARDAGFEVTENSEVRENDGALLGCLMQMHPVN